MLSDLYIAIRGQYSVYLSSFIARNFDFSPRSYLIQSDSLHIQRKSITIKMPSEHRHKSKNHRHHHGSSDKRRTPEPEPQPETQPQQEPVYQCYWTWTCCNCPQSGGMTTNIPGCPGCGRLRCLHCVLEEHRYRVT